MNPDASFEESVAVNTNSTCTQKSYTKQENQPNLVESFENINDYGSNQKIVFDEDSSNYLSCT